MLAGEKHQQRQQMKNTLENGYLDIVVHSLSGVTNLTLNDHKKIQLLKTKAYSVIL